MIEIFAKVLTENDDSGRHGVLIPDAAYSFFPPLQIDDPAKNATDYFEAFNTRRQGAQRLAWKYYQRYPERRVTRVGTEINSGHPHRIIVFQRTTDASGATTYLFDFATSADAFRRLATEHLVANGVKPKPGAFVRYQRGQVFNIDAPLKKLLTRFDSFRGKWHRSMRSGPTGVGYTFESLMGVEENNDKTADFEGIELKAKVRGKTKAEGKTNLFQEKPEWLEELSQALLIRKIGQQKENGRWACYSAVTIAENNLGLHLLPRDADARVDLRKRQDALGFWRYDRLGERLAEKHSRAVFVKASARGPADNLSYNYDELVYCERPRIENFVALVKTGDILFEFTMSEKDGGKIRNHGYPWRMKDQSVLDQLFAFQVKLRG